MTKSQHTPGPWFLGYHASFGKYAVDCGDKQLGNYHLAYALGSSDEEAQANARLIAAAPDLFEACKNALADITNATQYDCGDRHTLHTVKMLQIAIANAEGKLEV